MIKNIFGRLLILSLVLPNFAIAARVTSGGWDVDRGDLDNDIVEEFAVPVLFGINYVSLQSDFGDSRSGGSRSHEGQDLLAPKGTPIVSPTDAIVIRTGTGISSGKYVYTANPGGETFRYMHLDMIADIDPGDELEEGDFLGTVGDTGNAPDSVYHLHFETRDNGNSAQNPYPRMADEFTLKQKMSFVKNIFRDRRIDDNDYAEFLVETFPQEFTAAIEDDIDLPRAIDKALKNTGATDNLDQVEQLETLLKSLPRALTIEMKIGQDGALAVLLQLYLIYMTEGPARDKLAAAGSTGYYGSITAAAVRGYQAQNDLDITGSFDSDTRIHMVENDIAKINLQ